MTHDEFKSLLDSRIKSSGNPINEIHFAIHLDGKWGWRAYKTYTINFGWCIFPADETAKESYRRASRFVNDCFAKVYKKDGSFEEIKLPSPVFDNYERGLFWFEYGKETFKQFQSKIKKENKKRGWSMTIKEFTPNDIPEEWVGGLF